MKPASYIGVTGFVSREEVDSALKVLDQQSEKSARKLMVGVLASSKTLYGEKSGKPKRSPLIEDIAKIFSPDPRALNLVHYANDGTTNILHDLLKLKRLGGEFFHGFQINVPWPPAFYLMGANHGLRCVLQISRQALEQAGNKPKTVSLMLEEYREKVTDVLIDLSGGEGIPIDTEKVRPYIEEICKRHPQLGIGVAGGLTAQNLDQIQGLIKKFPDLNIDTESRIRDSRDLIDTKLMHAYLGRAYELLK